MSSLIISKKGDRVIPAGTIIIVSIAAVNFNPEWYPDPWKFNPDNFSPEVANKRHKLSFLSFSAGVRNCIGLLATYINANVHTILFLKKSLP